MKKLARSRKNRIIAGVCAGIGNYFDIDPTLVRLLYVLFTLFTMLWGGIIFYIIAIILIPEEPSRRQ